MDLARLSRFLPENGDGIVPETLYFKLRKQDDGQCPKTVIVIIKHNAFLHFYPIDLFVATFTTIFDILMLRGTATVV
jgi:hypothetical protein